MLIWAPPSPLRFAYSFVKYLLYTKVLSQKVAELTLVSLCDKTQIRFFLRVRLPKEDKVTTATVAFSKQLTLPTEMTYSARNTSRSNR